MTWHKAAWPHYHIPSDVIRHCDRLQVGQTPVSRSDVSPTFSDSVLIFRVLLLWVISFGFTKPSVKPWRLGWSKSPERWRTFTPWRGSVPENILWNSVAAKVARLTEDILCPIFAHNDCLSCWVHTALVFFETDFVNKLCTDISNFYRCTVHFEICVLHSPTNALFINFF